MHKRVVHAGTKYPNTLETDLLPEVMHMVQISDGTVREVMASDPSEAIRLVEVQLGIEADAIP